MVARSKEVSMNAKWIQTTGAGLMLARILAPVPLIFIGAGAGLAFHFLFRRKEAAP